MISRRALVRGLEVGILLPPFAGQAQPADKVWRIGFVGAEAYSTNRHFLDAFRLGLREHGYVEGQNVTIEARWAEGRAEHFHDLIADLIRLHAHALVTISTPAVRAALAQTDTIPIVFIAVDPLGTGLVSSLARPGRNVTGLSLTLGEELGGKWPELLREVVPRLSRVAVLCNPSNPANASFLKAVQIVAEKLGARLQRQSVKDPNQLEGAFAAMSAAQAQGLIVFPDPLTVRFRARIVDLAAKSRLPAVYGFREFVDAGGLMAYGTNVTVLCRRAAGYIDKIFKGAKPADLPVEQPTKFELVVNLKTAKALGLTIPQSLLLRADEVISDRSASVPDGCGRWPSRRPARRGGSAGRESVPDRRSKLGRARAGKLSPSYSARAPVMERTSERCQSVSPCTSRS